MDNHTMTASEVMRLSALVAHAQDHHATAGKEAKICGIFAQMARLGYQLAVEATVRDRHVLDTAVSPTAQRMFKLAKELLE